MSRNNAWKAASLALALGASTSGVLALAAPGEASEEPPQPATASGVAATKPEAAEVKPGVVRMRVRADGVVRPTRREAVRSPVAAFVTIRSILPSGTRVKEGDVIAELDMTPLQKQLTEQRAKADGARGRHEQAKLARQAAEVAVKEYEDGFYPQSKAAVQGAIKIAEAELAQSTDQVDRMTRYRKELTQYLEKKGEGKTPDDLAADQDADDRLASARISLQRGQFTLEQANSQMTVLERYTRPKQLMELQSAVQKALSEEKVREHEAERERAEEARMESLIAVDRLLSPVDGVVAAAQGPELGAMPPGLGVSVRERQIVAYVQRDDGRPGVTVDVSEERAPLIRPGQPVRVVPQPGVSPLSIDGVVEAVEPHEPPVVGHRAKSGRLVVIVLGELPRGPLMGSVLEPSVQGTVFAPLPGLAVEVEFSIELGPDALSVPRRDLVWYGGAYHVGVRKDDGTVEWREVVTGLFNDEIVEIRSGLEPGEAVVADPNLLLTEDQVRQIAIAPAPPVGMPPLPGGRAFSGRGGALQ